jgi:hypothetical protein
MSKEMRLLIEKFKNVNLTEGKKVGILYHNTSPINAINILKDNKLVAQSYTNNIVTDFRNKPEDFYFIFGNLIPKDKSKVKEFISFTRNKNYIRTDDNVQFVLDGDKISQNYKITPYSQFGGRENDEMEERVFGDVTNLNKYIIKVILTKPNPVIEDFLKEKNISYDIK